MSTATITTALAHGFNVGDVVCFEDIEWILLDSGLQPDQLNDTCWCVATVPSTTSFTVIIPELSNRIAFFDGNNASLRMYTFDEIAGTWSLTGNALAINIPFTNQYTSLSALATSTWDSDLATSRVAYTDAGNDEIRVYDFDGTDWVEKFTAGTSALLGSFTQQATCALSDTRIVFLDGGNIEEITTFDLDTTLGTWSQVGNGLNITGNISTPRLAAMTSPGNNIAGTFSASNSDTEGFGDAITNGLNIGLKFRNVYPGQILNAKIDVATVTTSFDSVAGIYANNSGVPGSQVGGNSDTVTLDSTGEKTYVWSSSVPALAAATDYWVVITDTTSTTGSVTLHTASDRGAGFESGRHDTITSIDDQSGSFPSGEEWRIDINRRGQIAYIDGLDDILRAYSFDGTTWAQVGNDKAITNTSENALTALSANRIVHLDGLVDKLETYDFDGTDWALVGSGATVTDNGSSALVALSKNRVALVEDGLNGLDIGISTYDFNGTSWALVGTRFSTGLTRDQPSLISIASFFKVGPGPDTTPPASSAAAATAGSSGGAIDDAGWTAYSAGGFTNEQVNTVTGLDHLEGEVVVGIDDGSPFSKKKVSSGSINLGESSRAQIGLEFCHRFKSLKPNVGAPSGVGIGKKKRIGEMTVALLWSSNFDYGDDLLDTLFASTNPETNVFTGERRLKMDSGWSSDERYVFSGCIPLPWFCMAVLPEIWTNDLL